MSEYQEGASLGIKPCPFCGVVPGLTTFHDGREHDAFNIRCYESHNQLEFDNVICGDTQEEVIAAWNTRPTEDALRERVKVLEEALLSIRAKANKTAKDSQACRRILRMAVEALATGKEPK